LAGVGVRFLTTLGVGVGFVCPTPTPEVQLDHFLHHTPKLGIPVEMVRLLLKFSFGCTPRFPLILTAKFHSFYVKESESEIFQRSKLEFRVGYFTSDSATLLSVLRALSIKCN